MHALDDRPVQMFRRVDWIHSKKGRGGGLEDSSSSDSEDDEGMPSSSQGSEHDDSEEDSAEDQLGDGGEKLNEGSEDEDEDGDGDEDEDGDEIGDEEPDSSILDTMADAFGDDEEMLSMCALKQGDAWLEAGEAGKLVRGRALTCVPCARKKKVLLLNSIMLHQHFTSAQHSKVVQGEDAWDDDGVVFRYADVQDKMGLVSGGETHQERLDRINAAVSESGSTKSGKKKATKSKKEGEGKTPKAQKRKTRPGKRQRQEQKAARAKEPASAAPATRD